MADPLSITTGCLSLIGVISKLSVQITLFAVEVHEALSDMAALRQELNSFSFSLDVLPHLCEDGTAPYPEDLKRKLAGVISVCASIIKSMEDLLDKMSSGSLARRVQWTTYGRKEMEKLRSNLKGHVLGIDIVMHTINHLLIKSIKQDTEQIKRDTSAIRDDTKLVPEIKEDTSQIKELLVKIHAQAPRSTENYMLSRYLSESITYAESVINGSVGDKYDEDQELYQPSHLIFSKSEHNEDAFKATELEETDAVNDKPEVRHTLDEDLPDRPTSPPAGNALTVTLADLDPPVKPVDDDPELPLQVPSQDQRSAMAFTDTKREDPLTDDDSASRKPSDGELARIESIHDTKNDAQLSPEDDVLLNDMVENVEAEAVAKDAFEDEIPKSSSGTEIPPLSQSENSISTIQPLKENQTPCDQGQPGESNNSSLENPTTLPNSLSEDISFIDGYEYKDPLVGDKEVEEGIIGASPSANVAETSPNARSSFNFSTKLGVVKSGIEKADKGTDDVVDEDSQLSIRLVCGSMHRWICCSSQQKLTSVADKIPDLARIDSVDLLSVKVGWRLASEIVEGPFNLVKSFSFHELGLMTQSSIYFAVAPRISEVGLFPGEKSKRIVSASRRNKDRAFLQFAEVRQPAVDSSLEVDKSSENSTPRADDEPSNPIRENIQVATVDSLGVRRKQPPISLQPTLPTFHYASITSEQVEKFFENGSRGSYIAALTFSNSFGILRSVFEKRLIERPPQPRLLRITLENINLCLVFGSERFITWARGSKGVFASLTSSKRRSFLGVSIGSAAQAEDRAIQTLAKSIGVLIRDKKALKEKRTPLTDNEVANILARAVREFGRRGG